MMLPRGSAKRNPVPLPVITVEWAGASCGFGVSGLTQVFRGLCGFNPKARQPNSKVRCWTRPAVIDDEHCQPPSEGGHRRSKPEPVGQPGMSPPPFPRVAPALAHRRSGDRDPIAKVWAVGALLGHCGPEDPWGILGGAECRRLYPIWGSLNGPSLGLWSVRSHSNAGDLRSGRKTSRVHLSICGIVRPGFGLRIPARGVAFRLGRSSLGTGRGVPLRDNGRWLVAVLVPWRSRPARCNSYRSAVSRSSAS